MTFRLAEAYGHCGRADAALALLEPLARADDAQESTLSTPAPDYALLVTTLTWAYYLAGRYEDQLAAVARVGDIERSTGDAALRAGHALCLRGIAQGLLGQWDDAVHTLQRASTLAEEANNIQTATLSLRHLSDCYERSGQFDLFEAAIAHGLELVDWLGHDRHIWTVFVWTIFYKRGLHAFYVGDWDNMRIGYDDAVADLAQMREGLPETWIPVPYVYVPFTQGHVSLLTGERERGVGYLEECIRLSARAGNLHVLRKATRELAEAELVWEQPTAARARLERVLAHPSYTGHTDLVPCLPLLAWAHLQEGDQKRAAVLLEEAGAPAIAQHHQLARLDILRVRTLLAISQGRWSAAHDDLEEVLALTAAMAYPYAEAKARSVAGQLALAKGEPKRAREEYQRALAICDRLGERLYRPVIERALAAC